MLLFELLCAQRRVGFRTALLHMERLGMRPSVLVGDLTDEDRDRLIRKPSKGERPLNGRELEVLAVLASLEDHGCDRGCFAADVLAEGFATARGTGGVNTALRMLAVRGLVCREMMEGRWLYWLTDAGRGILRSRERMELEARRLPDV